MAYSSVHSSHQNAPLCSSMLFCSCLFFFCCCFVFVFLFIVVIIAGKPATGKTRALHTVIAAVNNADQENSATSVKLARVFPQALEEFSDIFGCVNSATGDWEDGIFTSIFRKAHKVVEHTSPNSFQIF